MSRAAAVVTTSSSSSTAANSNITDTKSVASVFEFEPTDSTSSVAVHRHISGRAGSNTGGSAGGSQTGSPLKPKKRWIRESSSSSTTANTEANPVAVGSTTTGSVLPGEQCSASSSSSRKRGSGFVANESQANLSVAIPSPAVSASSDNNGANSGSGNGGGIRLKFSSRQNGSYAVQMLEDASLAVDEESSRRRSKHKTATRRKSELKQTKQSNQKNKQRKTSSSNETVASEPALALVPVNKCRIVGDMSNSASLLSVGDVVWAKLTGWPWWPGRVAGLQRQEELAVDEQLPPADQCIACVHWFNWDQVSYLPAERLRLFVDYYGRLFDAKKRGAYKTAVEQAYLIAHAPPGEDDESDQIFQAGDPVKESSSNAAITTTTTAAAVVKPVVKAATKKSTKKTSSSPTKSIKLTAGSATEQSRRQQRRPRSGANQSRSRVKVKELDFADLEDEEDD
uniref:PWWP domain-containing protein n=1 Tax=Macrostomum lignano TaxID=282301 RepID=A0A1I8GLS0_9PLAT